MLVPAAEIRMMTMLGQITPVSIGTVVSQDFEVNRRVSAPKPVSALTMLHQQRQNNPLRLLQHSKLALGPGITQLTGPAGSGKTQVALTLCVAASFDGKKSVYISLGSSNHGTWLTKVSLRLRKMVAVNLTCIDKQQPFVGTADENTHRLLSNVWLHGIRNTDDLMELFEEKLPKLLQQDPKISVVVLDSIASLFRASEDTNGIQVNKKRSQPGGHWKSRSSTFFKIATHCKYLSTIHHVPIIFVNDVTTKIIPTQSYVKANAEPALGLSWSQCVNTTYFVTRLKNIEKRSTRHGSRNCDHSTRSEQPISRIIRCLHSPSIQSGVTVEFRIDDRGAIHAS